MNDVANIIFEALAALTLLAVVVFFLVFVF